MKIEMKRLMKRLMKIYRKRLMLVLAIAILACLTTKLSASQSTAMTAAGTWALVWVVWIQGKKLYFSAQLVRSKQGVFDEAMKKLYPGGYGLRKKWDPKKIKTVEDARNRLKEARSQLQVFDKIFNEIYWQSKD